jgi:Zn-dependent protease
MQITQEAAGGPKPFMRLAGIDIRMSSTWIVVAVLFVLMFTENIGRDVGVSGLLALLGGILSAVLFFACVLAHEFGHALTARRLGIRTEAIELNVFGGVAKLEAEPRNARQELLISAAGPVTSLLCATILVLIAWPLPAETGSLVAVLRYALFLVGVLSGMLAVFNLLPGFPLDGGRVYRAILWRRTRSWRTATLSAARMGRRIAFGMFILGIAGLFAGWGWMSALLLGFLGFVILQAASMETLRAMFRPGEAPGPGAQPSPGSGGLFGQQAPRHQERDLGDFDADDPRNRRV